MSIGYGKYFIILVSSLEFSVGESTESGDKLCFLWIIGTKAWTVKVMEPFCKVDWRIFIVRVPFPMELIGLIGLILTRNKSPHIATDVFKVKYGEVVEDGVACASCQPFGIDDRTSKGF